MSYPIEKISFSCLRTFQSDQGLFKERYIDNIRDDVSSPAMLVWKMAHATLENYFKNVPFEQSVQYGQNLLENTPDEKIDFGKTGSREKILQDFTKAVKNYFEEMPKYGDIISVEEWMTADITDTIDGKTIICPLPFNGYTDLIHRKKDGLHIEDYKFVTAFKDAEEENPQYIFQAFFYYYLVLATHGEKPVQCTFREVKISTNKDGTSQHNLIVVPFSGAGFEENKVYFWYNVSSFLKLIENADSDTIFPYNIFDMVNGARNFKKQKESIFWYKREEIKQTEFTKTEERGVKEVQFLEQTKASTMQDKIRVKFQDYGVALKFERMESGFAYDRYLFEPWRGVKMAKVTSLHDEIKQALETESVRIEAPVSGTKFIGVEVPRTQRVFLKYEEPKETGVIPLWKSIDGTLYSLDLKNANTPHALVVWKTGSGKSVMLQIFIRALQNEHDLVLIDPKRTEFIGYKDIASFYAFNHAEIADEMERLYVEMMKRYEKISAKGCKDIDAYNKRFKKDQLRHKTIIVEEYAMLKYGAFGQRIEHALLQIVALGRAGGFHVVLSTQRPDTKIVSGNLKANIGARICFAVASQIDSRVTLDEMGAEDLVGMGDMLYMNPWKPIERLQAFYV